MLCWGLQEDTKAWHANCKLLVCWTGILTDFHMSQTNSIKHESARLSASYSRCLYWGENYNIKPNKEAAETHNTNKLQQNIDADKCRGMQRNDLGSRNYEGHMLEFKVVEQSEINKAISVKLQEDIYFTRSAFQTFASPNLKPFSHWPSHPSYLFLEIEWKLQWLCSTREDSREAVCSECRHHAAAGPG